MTSDDFGLNGANNGVTYSFQINAVNEAGSTASTSVEVATVPTEFDDVDVNSGCDIGPGAICPKSEFIGPVNPSPAILLPGANLEGSKFYGVVLTNANLTNANLSGADLTGTEFDQAKTAGVKVSNATICPEQEKGSSFLGTSGDPLRCGGFWDP